MDQDLHEELTKLHTNVALLVERTEKLPAVLELHDERIAALEDERKKIKYLVAGGGAVAAAFWGAIVWLVKELLS